MSLFDAVNIQELNQTEVDPKTHSTTVYTGLNFPDGGEGFLIIGRIQRDRKKKWEPLKSLISKVIVEYDEKYNPLQTPTEENSLLA